MILSIYTIHTYNTCFQIKIWKSYVHELIACFSSVSYIAQPIYVCLAGVRYGQSLFICFCIHDVMYCSVRDT